MGIISKINGELWIFTCMLIGVVIIQATIFLRMALKYNRKYQVLTNEEVKNCMKVGSVSVLAPALSVVVVGLTLIQMMGSAATMMRVGVIGSAGYELTLAEIAADTMGVTLGGDDFTGEAFTLALFTMFFGSMPYILNALITVKPMDMAMTKSMGKKNSLVGVIGLAAGLGLMGFLVLKQGSAGPFHAVGAIVSALVTAGCRQYIKKTGHKKLTDWILAIAIVVGAGAATLAANLFGA